MNTFRARYLHQTSVICRHISRKVKQAKETKLESLIAPAHQRNKDEKLMFGGVLETKRAKETRVKKQKKEGKEVKSVGASAPDSEAFWLANSSPQDLKLYRKTASGRYKEIDKNKLLEKLNSDKVEQEELKEISNNGKKIIMPEIIVRKLTSVPMLASNPLQEMSHFDKEKVVFPSVTKILSETMSDESKAALERWKKNMIAELGEQGFFIFNKEQLSFGARFHDCVRRFLEGKDPTLDSDLDLVWKSVQGVLQDVSRVQLLEAKVFHPKLKYKGVVDCVASYQDVPSVMEWKVSQKAKPQLSSTYDAPLQLTAYLSALSYDTQHQQDLRNGVVVVVYKDGTPADVFPMDQQACLTHWALWLQRLQLFWQTSAS